MLLCFHTWITGKWHVNNVLICNVFIYANIFWQEIETFCTEDKIFEQNVFLNLLLEGPEDKLLVTADIGMYLLSDVSVLKQNACFLFIVIFCLLYM
jgi:hypothetical protein